MTTPLPAIDPLSLVDPPEQTPSQPIAQIKPSAPKPAPFSYRHYHSLYPNCNKLLAHKWDQTQHNKHLKKLAAAKATVDNSAPKVYNHLKVNFKKQQMEEGQLRRATNVR